MNRRKALGGILGFTGVGLASFGGYKYFLGDLNKNKEEIKVYFDVISELIDVIIPTTAASPGAKSAGVQDYIIYYMEDCSSKKEYHNFLNGLKDLQEHCLDAYGRNFENCTIDQKIKQVENLDNNSSSNSLFTKIRNKLLGRSFFNIIKTLTIEGYCTSSIGATKHLTYLPVPGRYKAITELSPNQKSWATK